jgi:hypothetical protein
VYEDERSRRIEKRSKQKREKMKEVAHIKITP